ncbi:MAG TPA: EAL domain-containing protein [Candidatus Avidesulfovibrio excrementigallinarum]|nr:EAL domain-containing protein [Candidatus Avidesulfovibrio excrementigallinarum]
MPNSSGIHLSNLHYWRELKLLAERASRDVLSGLLNRETATAYIKQCLQHMHPGDSCALFIIDLDNFKQVNDTLGHQTGDQVIRLAARALSGCFRATDIVGRLGGDEFFALLSGSITEETAREKAHAICEALQFSIGVNPTLHVSASVGVYIATGETGAFEKLYERADAALYEAKAEGRNRYHISNGIRNDICDGKRRHEPQRETSSAPHAPLQLRVLLEHMEEGVALLDVGDTIKVVYASPSLCRMMETDHAKRSLPCELAAFGGIHPDDIPEYERRIRDALAGGKTVEYEHRFARGSSWQWCRARVIRTPLPNGRNVALVLVKDISVARKREDTLIEDGELLALALERGSRVLWEVDVTSRRFRLFNGKRRLRLAGVRLENFPESLIKKGWVHPDSVTRFRAFAEAMLAGRPAGGGAFILRHKMSRRYGWFSVFYRILPDRDRRPLKVVGIAEPLSGGLSSGVSGKNRLWEALRPNLFSYIRSDLTADCVEALWTEGRTLTEHLRGTSCREMLEWEKKRLFLKEDREEFLSLFGREALLEAFAQGREWVTREYRRADAGGTVRWLSYTVHLARHPLNGNVQAFGFLQDTERRHMREAALAESSRDLPVDGRYGRKMAWKLTENVLESGASPPHMLALVRVFGLYGPETERQRRFIAMAFALLWGADCVLGERGENAFTVFRPDAVSPAVTRQRIDEAFAFVRQALSDGGLVTAPRFVAAVACADLGGMDYEALLRREEQCCAAWEAAAADSVVFIDEVPLHAPIHDTLEADRGETATYEQADVFSDTLAATPLSTSTSPLSNEEKDVALACLDVLLMDDSPDVAMAEVLRRVGQHYQADRVYTLSLAEDDTVRAGHEWMAEGHHSLKKHVSGMPLNRLPLLRRCLRENVPFRLHRQPDGGASGNGWSYAVFPLAPAEGGPDGLLCVENPRRNMQGDALPGTLLPHIERALRLSGAAGLGRGATLLDSLTGLQNLRAYMDKVCTLTSDTYSSMGAFTLDIPCLAEIGNQHGRGQSSRLLLHLAETLSTVFGRTLLFRTRSGEFAALCPNSTQDVFLARVLRAQSMLQRRYPGQMRFGYTWSEGLFSGDKLVKEARTIMLCGRLEASAGGAAHPALGMRGPGMAGTGGLETFTIYLQPKVDMRTGALTGAEALARGLDGAGRVIEPGRFLEAMEQTGAIRELDLHVLNMVLASMDEWRRKGWKLVPVSVNFSRTTLFSVSAPGSVLALFSRYPLLAPDLVEIEISENAGDVENRTLERAMAGFRPFGLRFGLDDFGTRYANLALFTDVAFETVKLDKGLIRNLAHNAVGRALVGDIVRLCAARGMACVAEGVENKAQVEALLAEGCVLGQGFYYGRPMAVEDFERKYLRPGAGQEGVAS